jgi:transposase-like protein
VSVHHCRPCRHYFRAQPPFLRPNAIYTNRVVAKAVQAVYHDGLAMRRVAERLARDFWVRPSEGMVRRWCREYSAGLDFAGDYQPWVVREFSGVLCVDEVYQGRLALLLAVDPAAPDGDRLVGYQLVQGTVDQGAVAAFLTRLREAGIAPAEVITDGSQLYPTAVAAVWPAAAHQLCLFHETRRVTRAVDEVVRAVRTTIPQPPPATRRQLGGRRRKFPVTPDAADPATHRWRWREATRGAGIAQVHELRRRGWSLRAIARQTGFNRRTVTAWLRREVPQAQTLPLQPERQPPDEPEREATAPLAPWATWDEVRQVRHELKVGRALLLRRPDHLTQEERAQVDALLASPVGAQLGTARRFLEEWFTLWRDAAGGRPSWDVAQRRHARWHTDSAYQGLAPLRRVQCSVDGAQFARLSHFLRRPTWEATNNGAERAGRAFRHGQGPHFNLRSAPSIDDLLKARAYVHKERTTAAPFRPHGRRTRGRRGRPAHFPLLAA